MKVLIPGVLCLVYANISSQKYGEEDIYVTARPMPVNSLTTAKPHILCPPTGSPTLVNNQLRNPPRPFMRLADIDNQTVIRAKQLSIYLALCTSNGFKFDLYACLYVTNFRSTKQR